jgi:hypothetical protein
VSVERLGVIAEKAAARAGAVLYDGAQSVELPDGRALWLFGDTFFGERGTPGNPDLVRFFGPTGPGAGLKSIRGAVCHTAMLADRPEDWAGAAPTATWLGDAGPLERGPLIPVPEEEAREDPGSLRVWPMHGIHAGGRVLLFYAVIRILKDAEPPFNFDLLGVGLAEGDPLRPPLRPVRGPLGWRVVPRDAPAFGAWVLQADMGITDGFDYLYGTRAEEGANRCYVARVPHGREADPSAWRWFDGAAWSEDVARAAPLFDGVPGELSVSYDRHLGRFLAVHAVPLGREIVARGSDRPEGPWSAPTVLFRVPPPVDGGPSFVYAGKEHPEMQRDGGRTILVTSVDSREGVPALRAVTFP